MRGCSKFQYLRRICIHVPSSAMVLVGTTVAELVREVMVVKVHTSVGCPSSMRVILKNLWYCGGDPFYSSGVGGLYERTPGLHPRILGDYPWNFGQTSLRPRGAPAQALQNKSKECP